MGSTFARKLKTRRIKKDEVDLSFFHLLRTSWSYQIKEFSEKSSLHGIRYVGETERPFCERFMWFCFIMAGVAIVSVNVASLWDKYQTNPTITGLDMDFHNWDVPFPAITLCPENTVNETQISEFIYERWGNVSEERAERYKNFLIHLGNISYESLADFAQYKNDFNLPQDNLRKIFNQVVLRCEDFIDFYCSWKDESYACCKGFFPVLSENGFCYSFNSERIDFESWPWLNDTETVQTEYIFETDSNLQLTFKILDSYGKSVRIYIHNNNEVPDVEFFPQHVWIGQKRSILFSAKHTYTMDDVRQLSIQQRHCVFEDEIPLVTDKVYTFSACMAECRMKFAMSKCNCVPFFYKETSSFPHCTLSGLSCLAKFAEKLKTDLNCDCELGCKNTVYEVEKIDGEEKQQDLMSPNQPTLIVGFLSWPTVRYKREVLFGWVDLLVAFGGIAGLFLGFSLLSGIEIFYFFTLRALCMLHTDKKKLRELHRQYKWEKESRLINLDLEPFIFGRKYPKLHKDDGGSLSNDLDGQSCKIDSKHSFTNSVYTIIPKKNSGLTTVKNGRVSSTSHYQYSDFTIPYLP